MRKGKFLVKAGELIASGLTAAKSDPGKLARWAQRIGSAANPQAIARAARENPISSVLLLAEMGELTSEFIAGIEEEAPDLAAFAQQVTFKKDPVPEAFALSDLSKFDDEMKLIDDASFAFGGIDKLLMLRNCFALDNKHFLLHAQLRNLGRR